MRVGAFLVEDLAGVGPTRTAEALALTSISSEWRCQGPQSEAKVVSSPESRARQSKNGKQSIFHRKLHLTML